MFLHAPMLIWIYFIYTFILFFAILTILAYNPIHSLLSLILVFVLSSILVFTLGIDFLALCFLIIYAGAIAVLFLFVFMMIDLGKGSNMQSGSDEMRGNLFLILIFFFGFIGMDSFFKLNFLFRFYILLSKRFFSFYFLLDKYTLMYTMLFKKYFILFLLTGFLLLISMCGIIFILRSIKSK